MTGELPEFMKRKHYQVQAFVMSIFTNDRGNHLVRLIQHDDGHFRVIFRMSYFVLSEGQDEPSKSQWGTLKKKLKRHDRHVFVFKKSGEVPCETQVAGTSCGYIDFGYLA